MNNSSRFLLTTALTSALFLQLGCGRGGAPHDRPDYSGNSENSDKKVDLVCPDQSFTLKPEFSGPCKEAQLVDVNLGNSAEGTVRALHCQIYGEEPPQNTLAQDSAALSSPNGPRRIDLAWKYCLDAGKNCSHSFSDPWKCQVDVSETCDKKVARDVGAVMMFFSDCPDRVNCGQYWANTHAPGMSLPQELLLDEDGDEGYYNPQNRGFWASEFKDARWAGVQFLLLNTYGPDLATGALEQAVAALDDIGGGVTLGLFDDTWGWRQNHPPPFNTIPDLSDTESAATQIFEGKWRPFFDKIPDKHRYKHNGRPFIYFYNAGTLRPREAAPAVITRLKELFFEAYGEDPYVIVDSAFFAAEELMNVAADGRFTWYSFGDGSPGDYSPSVNTLHSETLTHAMVRWDATGRDGLREPAPASALLRKGPELLAQVLESSSDSDFLVLATWNDLGEGTGVHRNYDYYYEGKWLEPLHFLSMIRDAQCN